MSLSLDRINCDFKNLGLSFDRINWDIKNRTSVRKIVSAEEYEQFKYEYIFDALEGLRYGQAFCKRFGIGNASPLYFFRDHTISERWINDNYLKK